VLEQLRPEILCSGVVATKIPASLVQTDILFINTSLSLYAAENEEEETKIPPKTIIFLLHSKYSSLKHNAQIRGLIIIGHNGKRSGTGQRLKSLLNYLLGL